MTSTPADGSSTAISLHTLPDYERRLLTVLAFFLGRDISAQARACLCMYLRQSEDRIMAQVRYYAHRASRNQEQPLSAYDLMDLIYEDPAIAAKLLADLQPVHLPRASDVFGDDL